MAYMRYEVNARLYVKRVLTRKKRAMRGGNPTVKIS